MNRICPSAEILSEYLSGVLPPEDKERVEKHLAGCAECRRLVVETYDIINKPDLHEIRNKLFQWARKNRWFIGSFVAFVFSFLFPRYFLQFLVACLLMGAKWALDSKTARLLIMIHEAWKRGDTDATDEILSRIDKDKR
ncbi:MAG: zf-HC2 domain-containing protein [Candidatus Omnitrophota bacterium]